MKWGRIFRGQLFETYLEKVSASASNGAGFIGQQYTVFRSPSNDFELGIHLVYGITEFGESIEFHIPTLGIDYYFEGYSRLDVKLIGTVYGDNNTWFIPSARFEFYKNSVLFDTAHVGDVFSLFVQKVPSSIPFIGCAGFLSAEAYAPGIASIPEYSQIGYAVPVTTVVDEPEPAGTSASSGTVKGGWRWGNFGSPITLPTVLNLINPPSISCAVSAPSLPTVSTNDTYDNTATAHASSEWDTSTGYNNIYGQSCWIQEVPTTPRRFRKIGEDYSALCIRYGIPGASRHGSASCNEAINHVYEESVPERAQYLDIVHFDPHVYEDALNDVPECLYHRTGYHQIVPDFFTDGTTHRLVSEFLGADTPPTGNIPALNATNSITRYWDYVVNPHWSHKLWFEDWDVQGSSQNLNDYWAPIREQWQYDAALDPNTVGLETRNHIVLDPLASCIGWHETYIGHGPRELGLHRWINYPVNLLNEYQYDSGSESLWNTEDCTIVHGANLVITADPGKTAIAIELDLGDFEVTPFEWVHLANQIKINWLDTDIDSISFMFKAIDDETLTLPNTKDTWLPILRGTAVKYAGSWGIDNGAGLVYDLGVDVDGDGISPATMADAERAGSFQFLTANSKAKLRIEITTTNPGDTVTVYYPRFRMEDDRAPELMYESGQCSLVMYNDGPGIRFGNSTWKDDEYPPLPVPSSVGLGFQRTVVDCLCDINIWLLAKARAHTLTTRLLTLFDGVEATTFLDYWFDTYGVMMPSPTYTKFVFAVGNLLAECPPLALCPRKERDSDWYETGDFCLDVWSWVPGIKYYATPGTVPIHLFDGVTQLTDAMAVETSGWAKSKLENYETDNTETTNIDVKKAGVDRAAALPWHGYLYEGETSPSEGGSVHTCHSRPGLMYTVIANADEIKVNRFDLALEDVTELAYSSSTSGIGRAQIGAFADTLVVVIFEEDGTIKRIVNAAFASQGLWTMPDTIATGTNPAFAIDPKHSIEYVAGYVTDRWKLYRALPGESFAFVSDIIVTATDDSSAGLEVSPNALNSLVFTVDDAGTKKRIISTDYGENWT